MYSNGCFVSGVAPKASMSKDCRAKSSPQVMSVGDASVLSVVVPVSGRVVRRKQFRVCPREDSPIRLSISLSPCNNISRKVPCCSGRAVLACGSTGPERKRLALAGGLCQVDVLKKRWPRSVAGQGECGPHRSRNERKCRQHQFRAIPQFW